MITQQEYTLTLIDEIDDFLRLTDGELMGYGLDRDVLEERREGLLRELEG